MIIFPLILSLTLTVMINADAPFPNQGNELSHSESVQYGPPQSLYGLPSQTTGQPLGISTPQSCPPNNPKENLKLVLKAYQEAFGDKNFSNMDKYYHQDYIQHNPLVADGLDALKEALKGKLGQGPPMKLDFKRCVADGDLVWVHLRLPLEGLQTTFAAVDIFRVECGKIKEHWDVLQDTNLTMPSANPHPFF